MNIFLVIPTIRTLDFLHQWNQLLDTTHLLIVEDHATKEIATPEGTYRGVFHYTWQDIAKDFGDNEWIFSRKNAGIRAYGFWKAYTLGADIILTLDDDCFPVDSDFVEQHVANLATKAPSRWFATFPDRTFFEEIEYSKLNTKYPIINRIEDEIEYPTLSEKIVRIKK